MERIDRILPQAKRITGGSGSRGSSKDRDDGVLRLDDEVCPHCGRSLEAEYVEFPPALAKKYGKPGEWDYLPCTPECEKKNERQEWEHARRESRVVSLKERSGLSKRMKGYTLDSFNKFASEGAVRAFEKVMRYVDEWEERREDGSGLYFFGGVGTGKTHLAVAVMNEVIQKKRVPGLFVTVPELLDNIRGTYNDPGRNLDDWMDAVKNAEMLVLDDLGSERATEWVQERIFVIVNHRYREALPTIFTSNIGPQELPAKLGDRTSSRIIAVSEGVRLDGRDHRETVRNEGR
ncbi:ATP-binding protein [Rubrobacter indicoceani]|uniref:ATP-binding protein n=1 Tax=Rubrobacter indicoceani TaxID=2051957 RepID=UPI000E5B0A53|nr:ATP-binding protein [Rubrobacter indicoceani]